MGDREAMSLAVVVATRDRPALLADALGALGRSRRRPDRVVVVDSASVDPRVGEVGRAAGAEVLRCDRPGTSRARNVGWRSATEELVAFVDDDCLVDAGWVEAVRSAFAHPARPSFVTGRVEARERERRRAWLKLSLMTDADDRVLRRGDDPGLVGHGANMAWRRDALESSGGFDEAMGPGAPLQAAEDVDLFWRALEGGLTGLYCASAVVEHRARGTRRELLRAYHSYGVGAGALWSKQGRAAPQQGRAAAWARRRTLVLEEGVRPVARALRSGHQMAALADALKLAGAVEGAWRARGLALAEGHFVERPAGRRGG